MIPLPAAVTQWGPIMADLADDVYVAMVPMLQRMSVLLASAGRVVRSADVVNGFDGITRRGTYERLLTTEWALLDDHPLEFLRRAASREQGFLQVAYADPAATPRVGIALDGGPMMLGVPRIAQLAALIILVRMIERDRGSVVWTILQEPDIVYTSIDRTSVRVLLEYASIVPPTDGDIDTLPERFGIDDRSACWVVGHSSIEHRTGVHAMRRLLVDEPLDTDTGTLRLKVLSGHRETNTMVLPLPDSSSLRTIVRRPFRPKPKATEEHTRQASAARPTSDINLLADTTFVARSRNNGIMIGKMPSARRKGFRTTAFHLPEGRVIATGIHQHPIALWLDQDKQQLVLGGYAGTSPFSSPRTVFTDLVIDASTLNDDRPLGTLEGSLRTKTVDVMTLLDDGRLIAITAEAGGPLEALEVTANVVSFARAQERFHCVQRVGEHSYAYKTGGGSAGLTTIRTFEADDVRLGSLLPNSRFDQGLLAIKTEENVWDVYYGRQSWTSCKVGGAIHAIILPPGERTPSFLVSTIGHEVRHVELFPSGTRSTPLFSMKDPILHLSVRPDGNRFLCQSSSGIALYSMKHRNLIHTEEDESWSTR